MKRKLSIFLSVFLVVVCLALPCFAAEFDYVDFIENYNTDGTVVDVEIPASSFSLIQWKLYNSGLSTIGTSWGVSSTFNLTGNTTYGFGVFPFSEDFLILDDIPSGTQLDLWLDYRSMGNYEPANQGRINFDFFDANGNFISSYQSPWESLTSNRFLSSPIDKPNNAKYVRISGIFRSITATATGSLTVTFEKAVLHLDINAMYVQQVQTGRTNKLLQNIQHTFDDFINRDPVPEVPDFKEPMDDVLQAEQNILDRLPMQSVLDEFRNKESLVSEGIQSNINAFSLFTLLWEKFFTFCSWYEFLCYFALVLGSLMAFVGITSVFISRKGNGNE